MPLVSMKDMLEKARKGGYAIGYFESWNQESLEAVVGAAEELRLPVIIGFGCVMMDQDWLDSGGLEYFAALGTAAASRTSVPVALLLNEAVTFKQVIEGIKHGFNVVMMDTSHLPFDENLRVTKKVVEAAHPEGVCVEGELGCLPTGKQGIVGSDSSTGYKTDPEDAARFVKETGIDALSVSIGNVHALTEGKAQIDFERLTRIREATNIPLVIHGGTGFPDDGVRRAIELGACKFNVGTILKQSFLEGMKKAMDKTTELDDVQRLIGSRKSQGILTQATLEMKKAVKKLMQLYSCVGKAGR